jgi:RNA polymerase sigma-70 factor, ECF subfamily
VEKEVIRKAIKGDADALAKLVSKYQTEISRWAFKVVKNTNDAADVTQEVVLKILTSISNLQEEDKFLHWVYRITYNLSLNWLRTFKKMPTIREPEDVSYQETHFDQTHDTLLEKKEDIFRLNEALKQLPMAYQVIITLYYFDNKSYEEIAEILKIPIGTVKTQLYRAKEMLKSRIIKPINSEK